MTEDYKVKYEGILKSLHLSHDYLKNIHKISFLFW
jgi:hypothetical protein